MEKIDSFQGEYRFLSNFWLSPVCYGAHTFPSVENAYQAAKISPSDVNVDALMEPFCRYTPGQAKRKGKAIPLRQDWDMVKLDVMQFLVRCKFSLDYELADKLLETGDAILIEGNTWGDTYWGVCRGEGQNHLGRILMQQRDELKRMSTWRRDGDFNHDH